jgi:hypothetical protein
MNIFMANNANRKFLTLAILLGSLSAMVIVYEMVRIAALFTIIIIFGISIAWITATNDIKNRLFKVTLWIVTLSFVTIESGYRGVTLPEITIAGLFFMTLILVARKLFPLNLEKLEKAVLASGLCFIAGGFLTMYYVAFVPNAWLCACVAPVVLLFLCFLLIREKIQIEKSMTSASIAVIGFIFFIGLGFLTGRAIEIPGQEGSGQLTAMLDFGLIQFETFATWLGATPAIIFPVLFLTTLKSNGKTNKIISYLSIFVCLYFYSRTMTRAGAISLLVSSSLIISIISFRIHSLRSRLGGTLILLGLLLCAVSSMTKVSVIVERSFQSLWYDGINSPNLLFRTGLVGETFNGLLSNPLGVGFGSLYQLYEIDEVIFYSWIANGVGIIGIIGLLGIWSILAGRFIKGLFCDNEDIRYYSLVGISTLVATLIVATGNDQILWRPQTAFPFWLIMGATFKARNIFLDSHR